MLPTLYVLLGLSTNITALAHFLLPFPYSYHFVVISAYVTSPESLMVTGIKSPVITGSVPFNIVSLYTADFTVIVLVASLLFAPLAVIVTVPGATPVTTPFVTVAFVVSLLSHVTVLLLALLGLIVAVNVIVDSSTTSALPYIVILVTAITSPFIIVVTLLLVISILYPFIVIFPSITFPLLSNII